MKVFERFLKREVLHQKTIEIDNDLYEKIEYLSKYTYEATISNIINECIYELIRSEKINMYPKEKNSIKIKHTIILRDSALKGLEKIKKKYGISISKLIDISIRNIV